MAFYQAPSFEALEQLSRSRDADLARRELLDVDQVRGRGAQSNRSGRFEKQTRESFDDGWDNVEPLSIFETVEHNERAKTIITTNDSPDIGFERSINAYRGCEHGCSYCYARPSHAFLGHSAGIEFERDIYVKTNAVEALRTELSAKNYRVKPIAMGTNTDPYQPAERKHKLTRGILEVMLATRHPVMITTKSALITRDLDLLTELAKLGLVKVAISMTSMDHKLSRRMEPRASSPARRLEAIRLLTEAGVPVAVFASPMIPAINDMELERILDAAAAQGATSAQMILLRLPGEVRDVFREWLLRHFPDRVRHVLSLVRDTRGGKDYDSRFGTRMTGEGPYATLLRQRFEKARERYGLDGKLPGLRNDLFEAPEIESAQMSLF
ncbi:MULTISPECIES: PA0069 family radical SAM protein [Devosia]|jgi:DNA repair photolyase|uniref:PA0069 family radical SAM protein n=1 Tax=Devosia litorisediminis TaxID=2829817 RepID=A0A942E745_9HYPH|nr:MULTISPECIES: PA0069 family radical SAM protein [Devosia]MBS3849333.1 PA0069 family radical SAM protein [Devosia litorisediminis]MCZ4344666.1 PA0069 family radical SAM protein [Devosia neptuniae]|tara:strand:- start:5127 stop:6275 length:1149 start_codon:yes stop_codon:yes gene_type:complete